MNLLSLSRELFYILRHNPGQYNLELDDQGWVDISDILEALHRGKWVSVTRDHIECITEADKKGRFEISGDRIRARYGHSLEDKVKHVEAEPPVLLFHGTSDQALVNIMQEGIKPMQRQYVHLANSIEMAVQVVKRYHFDKPVLIVINSAKAFLDGISFYHTNTDIWLADHIDPKYIAAQITFDDPDDLDDLTTVNRMVDETFMKRLADSFVWKALEREMRRHKYKNY